MTDPLESRGVQIPDDMRGYYLPGHRFFTEKSAESDDVILRCACGFSVEGNGRECVTIGAGHCRESLADTDTFHREIVLRFGVAIAVWAYDPHPYSWVATSSLCAALDEYYLGWIDREDDRRKPR